MTRARATAVAAALGLTGVAAGAFGAHGLREAVTPEALEIWRTGAHYQQLHAVAMLALALGSGPDTPTRRAAMWAFTVGTLIFAGTLYGLTLGGPRWLGAVTPLGGLGLMVGWLLAGIHGVRDRA